MRPRSSSSRSRSRRWPSVIAAARPSGISVPASCCSSMSVLAIDSRSLRRRVEQLDRLGRFAALVALQRPAVGQPHSPGDELRLHLPLGPQHRLGDLLRLQPLADIGQRRPDRAAVRANLWHDRQANFAARKTAHAAAGVAVLLGGGDQIAQRSWRRIRPARSAAAALARGRGAAPWASAGLGGEGEPACAASAAGRLACRRAAATSQSRPSRLSCKPLLRRRPACGRECRSGRGSRWSTIVFSSARSSSPWPSGRILRPVASPSCDHAVEVEAPQVRQHLAAAVPRSGPGARGRGAGCRRCRHSAASAPR